MAQQVGALGMGAYGLSKFMAEGGMAYADGGDVQEYRRGGGVDSRENVEDIVGDLKSDQALQQALMAARVRGDRDQVEAVEDEIATRASLRRGIAGGVTNDMAERMAADGGLMDSYAGGGIVAFARGGLQDDMARIRELGGESVAPTADERMAGIKGALPGIQSLYGESALKPFMEDLKKDREGLGKQKEQGEGLAFIMGAKALLRPGSKSRALTEMASELGTGLAKANKDYTDANSKLRQAEMTLAASEQARADGQIGKAESLYEKGVTDKKEAVTREIGAREKLATIQANVDNSIRSANAQMAGVNRPGELERQIADYESRLGRKLSAAEYKQAIGEFSEAKSPYKYLGPDKSVERNVAVENALNKDISILRMRQELGNPKTKPERKAEIERLIQVERDKLLNVTQPGGKGAGAAGMTMTMDDVQATAQAMGKSPEEVMAAAKRKGYTIQ
jgi:hypothetical protein